MPGPGLSQAEHLSKADLFYDIATCKLNIGYFTNCKWNYSNSNMSLAFILFL